jgi:hypothetical protein
MHSAQFTNRRQSFGLWFCAAGDGRPGNHDEVRPGTTAIGEGNVVLAVGEGACGGKLTSFYDLFRVENSKFAEH